MNAAARHKAVAIITTIVILVSSGLLGCANAGSDMNTTKRDHESISSVLDKALLSTNPKLEFENALEKVKAYPSVDSAWISGLSFFVKYKEGGTVAWTIQPSPR